MFAWFTNTQQTSDIPHIIGSSTYERCQSLQSLLEIRGVRCPDDSRTFFYANLFDIKLFLENVDIKGEFIGDHTVVIELSGTELIAQWQNWYANRDATNIADEFVDLCGGYVVDEIMREFVAI